MVDQRKPYGVSDLGAELWPCEKCGTVSILAFSLCDKCRPDWPAPKPEFSEEVLENILHMEVLGDTVSFVEACDYYYHKEMTKEEAIKLLEGMIRNIRSK